MIRSLLLLVLVYCSLRPCDASAQQQDSSRQRDEMPRLEIPEITIIGKKAITLPFARKGEIYDVEIYEAPPPDSSVLGQPPHMSLLNGSLPRYRQEEMPWRYSVEGLLGTFGTVGARGYVNYIAQQWGIGGNGGFKSTNGHTANADASSFKLGGDVHTLVRTDNAVLKTFRASLGMEYERNKYGLFAIPNAEVRRRVNDFGVDASFGSLNRQGTMIDVELAARFLSLDDSWKGIDSSVSAVSPVMRALLSSEFRYMTLNAGITYQSSSLDYKSPAQLPSLIDVSLTTEWKLTRKFSLEFGGRISHGADNAGGEQDLVMPLGGARWTPDSVIAVGLWFKPGMQFTPYEGYLRTIPYIEREFSLQPERQPIVAGSSLFYNRGSLSLEVRGTYMQSSNTPLQIADSGRIRLEYAEARKTAIDIEGALRLTNISRLLFAGTLSIARETAGSNVQLPMIPSVRLTGRWETDFRIPLKAWSSVEYLSPRNIDRAGTQSLGNVFLLNVGGSTNVFPRVVIAAEALNLLDTQHEWWSGYTAPGVQFNVTAKINFQ